MKISTVIFKSENEIYTDAFMQEENEILKRKLIKKDWDKLDLLPVSFLKRICDKSDAILVHYGVMTLNDNKAITTMDVILESGIDLDKVYLAHRNKVNKALTNNIDGLIYERIIWADYKLRKEEISEEELKDLNLYKLKTYIAASWCKLRTPEERVETNNRVNKEIEKEIEDRLPKIKLKLFELIKDEEVLRINTVGALYTYIGKELRKSKDQTEIDKLTEINKKVKALLGTVRGKTSIEFFMKFDCNRSETLNKIDKKNLSYLQSSQSLLYLQRWYSEKRFSLLDEKRFYKLILQMPLFQQTSTPSEIDEVLKDINIKHIRVSKENLDNEDLIRNHVIDITKSTINKEVPKKNIIEMLELVKALYKLDIYCYNIDSMQMSFAVPIQNKNATNEILKILQSLNMTSRVSRIYKTSINKGVSSFRDIDTEEYIEVSRGERW